MIPFGLGGNVGCDPVVKRRGRSGRGVVEGLFEAASPGQSKELGNQRGWSRLRSCSLITVSPTQPLSCLFLQPRPITAWPHGNSNMEPYQGFSFCVSHSLSRSLCDARQEKWIILWAFYLISKQFLNSHLCWIPKFTSLGGICYL